MDIGGGSTEFIICNKNEIFWKHSFQLGASRLLEKFQPKDPISCQGCFKARRIFRNIIESFVGSYGKASL